MPQETAIALEEIATCSICPYFESYGSNERGRGTCLIFDAVTRDRHIKTQDCTSEIEALEQQPEYEIDSGYSGGRLEYRVWTSYNLVGTFHRSIKTDLWVAVPVFGRDFNRYKTPTEAQQAVISTWEKAQQIRESQSQAIRLLEAV
ncbi:MAG: hypothetical protein NVS2B14_08900 [Chamaesiphon sp.]